MIKYKLAKILRKCKVRLQLFYLLLYFVCAYSFILVRMYECSMYAWYECSYYYVCMYICKNVMVNSSTLFWNRLFKREWISKRVHIWKTKKKLSGEVMDSHIQFHGEPPRLRWRRITVTKYYAEVLQSNQWRHRLLVEQHSTSLLRHICF